MTIRILYHTVVPTSSPEQNGRKPLGPSAFDGHQMQCHVALVPVELLENEKSEELLDEHFNSSSTLHTLQMLHSKCGHM